MDCLPEEVILHLLTFLDISSIIHLQSLSTRYLSLARDNSLWKTQCFEHSRSEALRRRQHLLATQNSQLAEIRNAVTALPGADLTAWDVAQLRGSPFQSRAAANPNVEARVQRTRALANWEPGYSGETFDYYEEFTQRHAPINIGWLNLPKTGGGSRETVHEATGVGILTDPSDERSRHLLAPLDDGSVCLYDISVRSTRSPNERGKLIARSQPGLLTGRDLDAATATRTMMTETGAVECVSIDNHAKKGYFAVQNTLQELDLTTLQLISTHHYPFPVTALSAASPQTPLTIGTNWTLHLHDPREPPISPPPPQGELIAGPSTTTRHATLSQPGPLSLLHPPSSTSLWVAGRFTSLLHYDLRSFPRLHSTLHSGARIASLSLLPRPLLPRSLDLLRHPSLPLSAHLAARHSAPNGLTLLAAAEYRGKGSLELYGLPQPLDPHEQVYYQNRQTASASKLLAAAAHGGRIVFADGDGNLKWVERDGVSHVRTYNINEALASVGKEDEERRQQYGIWSSSASEMPGHGDIVQKLVPLSAPTVSSALDTSSSSSVGRTDVNQADLLLWTGDGRLGLLGFGPSDPLRGSGTHDDDDDAGERVSSTTEQKAREDAERQHGFAMRRALERQADEVRFVRGLGMGFVGQG